MVLILKLSASKNKGKKQVNNADEERVKGIYDKMIENYPKWLEKCKVLVDGRSPRTIGRLTNSNL